MNKPLLFGCAGLLAVGVILALVVGIFFISTMNKEASLRNMITAKQRDNTSEFDNMWKKISQVAQVTDAQKNAIKDIVVGYADARSAGKGGGSLATMVHEAVPQVDAATFTKLMAVIESSRDAWTMRQKELIDLKRAHDNLVDLFPGSLVCSILGRQKIDITIVTSTKTDAAFQTGKDDDVQIFAPKTDGTRVEPAR
jgi:hypothetical protein